MLKINTMCYKKINGCLLFLVGVQVTWERMQQLGDIPCARDGHTLRFTFDTCTISSINTYNIIVIVQTILMTFMEKYTQTILIFM